MKITKLVSYSGGINSWATAMLVAQRHGIDGMLLLFADTMAEDPDLYRFLREGAAKIGAPLLIIADGRTPMQLMWDLKMLGHSRIDPCSATLKRELMYRWITKNCSPEETTLYFGIGWDEAHRLTKVAARYAGWRVESPLIDTPFTKSGLRDWLELNDVEVPALYKQGFPHNNCGGACVKAGQAQWALLYKTNPCLYAKWETWEKRMRAERVGDHTILKDRRGVKPGEPAKRLTLEEFRERSIREGKYDVHEWGGCGCALE